MSRPLDPKDAQMVDRIQQIYTPPGMSPEEQAAFDRRLKTALKQPSKARPLLPGALLAAAALLLWVQIQPGPPSTPASTSPAQHTDQTQAARASLLDLDDTDFWSADVDTTMLPDSYQQLSSLFLTP